MEAGSDAVAAAISTTTFVEMVFPERANHYGTLFGGNALELMGKAAFVAASRRARCPVVMATSDKVAFHYPVRVGELIELNASVSRVGRSSMTVLVDVIAEALPTGLRRRVVSGSFEMVAVDDNGRPVPVPAIVPNVSEEEVSS